eukprot:6053688-Prymnesium_polylepis.1
MVRAHKPPNAKISPKEPAAPPPLVHVPVHIALRAQLMVRQHLGRPVVPNPVALPNVYDPRNWHPHQRAEMHLVSHPYYPTSSTLSPSKSPPDDRGQKKGHMRDVATLDSSAYLPP